MCITPKKVDKDFLATIIFAQQITDELIERKNICYWRDYSEFKLYTRKIFIDMNERKYGNSTKKHSRKNMSNEKLDEME